MDAPTALAPGLAGFSTVVPLHGRWWTATPTQTGRPVAVKILDLQPDDVALRRLRLEAAVTRQLAWHPNVLPWDEVGLTADGRVWASLPLVPGGSLADRLLAQGPLPPLEVVGLLRAVLSVLVAAHADGVVHGHLSPANLLVRADGSVAVAEMGIADRTSWPAGTAPERLEGRNPSTSTDLYALGATVHALLTGRAPHEHLLAGARTVGDLAAAVRAAPPVELDAPGVPTAVAVVVARLLRPRPEDRPASAELVSRQLENALAAPDDPVVVTAPLGRYVQPEPEGDEPVVLPWLPEQGVLPGPAGVPAPPGAAPARTRPALVVVAVLLLAAGVAALALVPGGANRVAAPGQAASGSPAAPAAAASVTPAPVQPAADGPVLDLSVAPGGTGQLLATWRTAGAHPLVLRRAADLVPLLLPAGAGSTQFAAGEASSCVEVGTVLQDATPTTSGTVLWSAPECLVTVPASTANPQKILLSQPLAPRDVHGDVGAPDQVTVTWAPPAYVTAGDAAVSYTVVASAPGRPDLVVADARSGVVVTTTPLTGGVAGVAVTVAVRVDG